MAKQALGKGLGALIEKKDVASTEGKIEHLEMTAVDLNPQQPRKDFDETSLSELKDSLKVNGILQPIIVRRRGQRYEIMAGERRYRAARDLGWKKIPAIVKDASDEHSLEIALIENLQRQDLNPMEESRAYMALMRDYELTQDSIAERVGKNRASVANTLRLLNLPDEIQGLIEGGHLTFGHAKAILSLQSPSEQVKLAKEVMAKGWSVRETEEQVQERQRLPVHKVRILRKDPAIRALEERIESALHTKVYVKQGKKKGRIEIEYYSLDDLERLVGVLTARSK